MTTTTITIKVTAVTPGEAKWMVRLLSATLDNPKPIEPMATMQAMGEMQVVCGEVEPWEYTI